MSQPTVTLMRHAKSSWDNEGLSDFERPLNSRGKRASELMANHLANNNQVPARIISSTSCRTRETVAILNSIWKLEESAITWVDELYLASAQQIARTVFENWGTSPALLLGHNPGMQMICSYLAKREIEMPTAALCQYEWQLPTSPSKVEEIDPKNFRLASYATPRALEE